MISVFYKAFLGLKDPRVVRLMLICIGITLAIYLSFF